MVEEFESKIKKVLNNEILKDHEKRISALEEILLNSNPLDINKDGIVDKEDASIAGKVLADRRKRLKG